MTQDSNRRPSTHRRPNRPGRNRPVLVTPAENETSEQAVQELNNTQSAEAATPMETPRGRRLPNFFSKVGKREQVQEPDVAQARLARATKGKAPAKDSQQSEEAPSAGGTPSPAKTTTAPARPRATGGFKTRYLLGIVIYLLGANLIGSYEKSYFVANHLESNLIQLGPITVTTSTLAFFATLIIMLLLLARFDLIPRSLGALTGQPPNTQNKNSRNTQNTSESVKPAPPTMKQGVKGDDDDLYREYRENQRRERKK